MANQNSSTTAQLDELLAQQAVGAGAGAAATKAFAGVATGAPLQTPKAPRGGNTTVDENSNKMLRNALQTRVVDPKSAHGMIRLKLSERARACGYTTAANDKCDFAKRKDKAEGPDAYAIFVKMTPPPKVDGFIVRYPVAPWQELSKSNPDNMQVNAADSEEGGFAVTIIEASRMISWMQQFTASYLLEAEELFEPVVRKAGKNVIIVSTPADVQPSKKNNGVPAKPAIYVDVAGNMKPSKTGAFSRPKLRIKSNYRTKLVTPHNYIAKRKFRTMPVQAAYSQEDIANYIDVYFSRYLSRTTKAGKVIRSVFSMLSSEGRTYFHASEDSNGQWKLDATEFFTTDASASAWNTVQVAHWFEKDDRGEPIRIPGLQVQLAVREKESAEKPISFKKLMITDPEKAQPGDYVLDLNGEHKKIADACKGALTFSMLSKFYDDAAASTRKSSGSGLGSGIGIMGLTEDALEDILSNIMK